MKTWVRNLLIMIMLAGVSDSACGVATPKEIATVVPSVSASSAAPATVTPNATSTAVSRYDLSCWPMQNAGHRSLSGSLLYTFIEMDPERAMAMTGAPAVFDLKTGYSKRLKGFFPEDISPDGKIIFISTSKSNWTFLIENHEVSYPISKVAPLKDLSYIFLPNDQLLLEGSPLKQENETSTGITRDIYTFSLDTGKLTFIQSVTLLYSILDPLALHDKYLFPLYSPDYKYVLYPANYQGTKLSILLNMPSQSIVWYGWPDSDLGFLINPVGEDFNPPIWKVDSSGIILVRKDDKTDIRNFYNISLDGQVTQLTHLEELFPSSKYILSSSAISPDGRYLAFAFVQDTPTFPGRNSLLLILDLENGMIINPCITLANVSLPNIPTWSPDSSAIAIVPDAGNFMAIVDLKERKIYNIFPKTSLDAGSLLGWLDWEIP